VSVGEDDVGVCIWFTAPIMHRMYGLRVWPTPFSLYLVLNILIVRMLIVRMFIVRYMAHSYVDMVYPL
jgi:hypothetical protein